ncbi:alpha/beta hydrolase [Vibrio sp. JC009]|uniref:alpha/beta hydrolase family protein n=1 Tax=Vibrio sp. JC009 TaxID=2912314 RepID=UPI0023AEAC14|nr:alpha/beta hydrolase [Vibrio sp. JC009]WED23228.1 alpha/beta hydrolase [Vibrio sp. JC009]
MLGRILADTMIKPSKSPVFDTPANWGMDYEDVNFKAADGVTISAWLIKGSKNKVIIQSHFGIQCCRSGYTRKDKGMIKGYPTDIEFLNQAKYLVDEGYSVLMYDMRNHGDSEKGTMPWITWGKEEAKDLIAAVDYINAHPDYQDSEIGLFSICMGSSASIYGFAMENGLSKYTNIKAMVSIQPVDYPTFVSAMGIPGFLQKSTNKVIKKRTGIDFMDSTYLEDAKSIKVPTMIIQNKNDPFSKMDFVQNIYDNLAVEKEMLWLDIPKLKSAAHNRAAAYDWIGKNPAPIVGWFNKYIG